MKFFQGLGFSPRHGFVYGAYFIFIGLFAAYWPLWLTTRGVGPIEISILVTMTQLVKLVAAPSIAHISDSSGRRRDLFALCAFLSVVFFSLFYFADGFWPLLLVTVLAYMFVPTLLPLSEQIAMAAVREQGIDYARTRVVGSITFMVATVFGGVIIKWTGNDSIYWMAVGALALTYVSALILPREKVSATTMRRMGNPFALRPALALFRIPGMKSLLLLVGFIQGSHAAYYVIGSLNWKAQGIDTDTIGLLWAVGIIVEILLFVFAGSWIRRQGVRRILFVVAILGTIRWFGMSFVTDLPILFALQTIHGFTYGVTHLATMAYFSRHVPEHSMAMAQALYSVLPLGLMTCLPLLGVGIVFERYGALVYLSMMLMTIAALWPLWRLRRYPD